ncbi:MAG: hypothetical protein R2771_07820 [Saprospiraceae bacterium]
MKKGQLLAELDKTNLKEAVTQAKAVYDNSINELKYQQEYMTDKRNCMTIISLLRQILTLLNIISIMPSSSNPKKIGFG